MESTASEAMRFPIRRDPCGVPLLLLFGATSDRSYVELADDRLVVRFGWLFHHSFPLIEIGGAGPRSWPLLYGTGWRSNLVGVIGLVGSRRNVVEVRLRRRRWIWMILPLSCNRLAFSLEDPEAFLEALGKAGVPVSRYG